MSFPQLRLRRLRRTEPLRALVRENHINVTDLVYPMFVIEGKGIKQEITSMPGISRLSPDQLPPEVEDIYDTQPVSAQYVVNRYELSIPELP